MSRCFPYPPAGYVKGINDEPLIESIKLQREDEKAKKEKKREKKREKKEKKARENGELENKKHGHKKRHKDERHQEDEKGRDHGKKRKHETENLDKSSITEEHKHPVGSQNSFDSTVNSNKRQKQNSSPDGRHNSASIFRIRLPLQRHKDPEVLPSQLPIQKHKDPQVLPIQEQPSRLSLQRHKDPQVLPSQEQRSRLSLQSHKDPQVLPSQEQPSRPSLQRHKGPQVLPSQEQPSRLSRQRHKNLQVLPSQEQPCCALGRTDNAFVQGMHEAAPRQGRDEGQHPCSTSGNACKEVPVRFGKEKLGATGSASLSITSKYREVIENWDQPPLLQSLPMDVDDQGWLFETKQNRRCRADERIVVCDSLSYGDSASWPCSRQLPEADIYALPFTVPF